MGLTSMPSLLVVDLDAISDHVPGPQLLPIPTDRVLYPGVLGRLRFLRSRGWKIQIVSDQTACDWQKIPCFDLSAGSHFRMYHPSGEVRGTTYTTVSIEVGKALSIWTTDTLLLLPLGNHVHARDKTIDQAIDELTHVAELCGVESFAFCDCLKGSTAIESAKIKGRWFNGRVSSSVASEAGNLLPPGPGLLNIARVSSLKPFDRCVFIGTQPHDRAAADAADFEYIDFEDWRTGRVTV